MRGGERCVAALLGWLAPPLCWGCGAGCARGQPLCPGCRGRLGRLGSEPVLLCGVPVWAPVAYTGPARELVRALKFRSATGVADTLAAQMVANAPDGLLSGPPRGPQGQRCAEPPPAALVPVPLHPKRLRSRGYNQAALIAEAIARRTGLEVADCLVRGGSASTQVGRDRAGRRAGLVGAVASRPATGVPGRAVLVDDVATTGATLAACGAALVAHGCAQVVAVTFARTLGR